MLNTEIKFNSNEWVGTSNENSSTYAIGWASVGDRIIHAKEITTLLNSWVNKSASLNVRELGEMISTWNGNFSFVLKAKKGVFLGSDRIRSYPLQYISDRNCIYISDSFDLISHMSGSKDLDIDSVREYLTSGLVYQDSTLFRNIKSIRAGDIIFIDEDGAVAYQYYRFLPTVRRISKRPRTTDYKRIDLGLEASIRRMVDSAPDVNRWVIPLSGGYDSRLILNYLHRFGINNVLCFSYGKHKSLESEIAKKIAKEFGYEWEFVEYSKKLWNKILADEETERYLRFASNGTSIPVLQDYAALWVLKQEGKLKKNDIIVPGHSFDFLAGAHVESKHFNRDISTKNIAQSLVSKHAVFWWDKKGTRKIRERIENQLKNKELYSENLSFLAQAECFNWQERQSKFIVNNCRVYEYLGYGWRLPLWDSELMDYWEDVPMAFRLNRTLFKAAFKAVISEKEIDNIEIYGEKTRRLSKSRFNIVKVNLKMAVYSHFRTLFRIKDSFAQSRRLNSELCIEEYFTGLSKTVAELLDLNNEKSKWPEQIVNHFRWYERKNLNSCNSNAILSAYMVKQYLPKD